MNKKLLTFGSLLIIFLFIGYMIYDSVRSEKIRKSEVSPELQIIADAWKVADTLTIKNPLYSVAVSPSGFVYLGGNAFVSCYDSALNAIWNVITPASINALVCHGDTIFAASSDQIFLINNEGEIMNEWGPYEDNSIITSLSVNNNSVAFADAGNRTVFILDKGGEVKEMIGQNSPEFVVPSPYFDVVLNDDNSFYVANTGYRRVEKHNSSGKKISSFGEPGTAPDAFCGCCNPAHLISIPQGFVTAEKGINRIKIIDTQGKFIEFVSAHNSFVPSVPLDIASFDGKVIYAANPSDSKLYVFTRK
jgi:hypothetical protein